MTIINSYTDAAALFAKARNPEMGKPLAAAGWRMFKDGDEFVFYHIGVQVARILPTNQLIVVGYGTNNPPQGVVATSDKVLPIRILRRSVAHYRVHAVTDPDGGAFSRYGVLDWEGMRTGGVRLWLDAVFDLSRRVWLTPAETVTATDKAAAKVWRAQSTHIRNVLATMIRLGAIDTRIQAKIANGDLWYAGVRLTKPRPSELAVLVEAVRTGIVSDELADMFAQSCRRVYLHGADTSEQLEHMSAVFEHNSLALRMALGVITIKQGA